METFKLFLKPVLFAFFWGSLFSCSEEELTPLGSEIENPESGIFHHHNVITVYPSGDISGFTDAENIENALSSTYPEGAVQLAQGEFYTNRPVVVEGFNGGLRGSGKSKTTVIGVGTDTDPFPLTTIRDVFQDSFQDQPVLFYFPNPVEKVKVSDFTVTLSDGFFTEDTGGGFLGPNDMYGFFFVDIGPGNVNTSFSNLRLQGIPVNPGGPFENVIQSQPAQGIVVTGNNENFPFPISGGMHAVAKCHFDQLGLQSIVLQLLDHARLNVRRNVLTNVKQVITRYLNGSLVKIEDNNIDSFSFGAIVVTQEFEEAGPDQNLVFIRRNTINTNGFMGIEIGTAPNFKVIISYNKITVGPDPTGFFNNLTGIGLFPGQEKAVVIHNKVSGESEYAIALFGGSQNDAQPGVSHSLVVGNNVTGHSPFAASYFLDFGTTQNLVINKGEASFIDDGIDNRVIMLPGHSAEVADHKINNILKSENISLENL